MFVSEFSEVPTNVLLHKMSSSDIIKISDVITSNYRIFGCPIISMVKIHNAILFINTSTMLSTRGVIG